MIRGSKSDFYQDISQKLRRELIVNYLMNWLIRFKFSLWSKKFSSFFLGRRFSKNFDPRMGFLEYSTLAITEYNVYMSEM